MARIFQVFFVFTILVGALGPTDGVSADTIFMKNGRVYGNVVSVANERGYQLVFQNGRTMNVRREDVKRIKIQKVFWKPKKIIEYREVPAARPPAKTGPSPAPLVPVPNRTRSDRGFSALAFIPGARQFRDDRFLASAFFFTAFLGSAAAAADSQHLLNVSRDKLRNPLPIYAILYQQNKDQSRQANGTASADSGPNVAMELYFIAYFPLLRSEIQSRRENFENASILAGVIYLWNFLDAILFRGGSTVGSNQDRNELEFHFAFLPSGDDSSARNTQAIFGLTFAF